MKQTALWDGLPRKIEKPACLSDLWKECPPSGEIQSTLMKCCDHIADHEKIMCSISGGYDSDIMLDLIIRCGGKEKTTFVFYDTGLEYDATKEHIADLEERYDVKISRVGPKKAIPTCVKDYGVPFWSKYVSDMMSRLQRHGFRWEDGSFEELYARYPRCKAALRWWCSAWGDGSQFNISRNPGMKEFIQRCPPTMPISAMCCTKAKKEPAHEFMAEGGFDLNCTGVRKQEGGKRSTTYKSCFDRNLWDADSYRPLFWWSNADKELYRKHYGIIRSDCYEVWGMTRTGCAGCPFAKDFEDELGMVKLFEPKRYQAMMAIFGKSYDYTRKFMEFREKMKIKPEPKDETQLK